MLKQSSENTTSTQERRSTRVIFYNLSYIVQGAEHGTDGAIVLLHDIIGGATAWRDVLPQLAATNRAVYAIDMLAMVFLIVPGRPIPRSGDMPTPWHSFSTRSISPILCWWGAASVEALRKCWPRAWTVSV